MLNNPNEWHNIENESVEFNEAVPEDAIQGTETPVMPKNKNMVRLGLLVLIAFALCGFAAYKKISENKTAKASNTELAEFFYDEASKNNPNMKGNDQAAHAPQSAEPQNNVAQETFNNEPTAVVEVNLSSNSLKNNDVKKTANKSDPLLNNSTVTVKIGDLGRDNPFRPYDPRMATAGSNLAYNSIGFDIITPPTTIMEDSSATRLLESTISGIMYDSRNPSAIINIDGQDQLVRKGDKLAGYAILDITRDKVVIKSGSNIYRAAVGQSIPLDAVNINQVANLKRKFAGSYTTGIKSIEIKPN